MTHPPEHYTVDLQGVSSIDEMYTVLSRALAFPQECGHNPNGFWDFLSDMTGVPLSIEVYGLEQIAALSRHDHQSLLTCLTDLKHMDGDRYATITHITIISGNGERHEIK